MPESVNPFKFCNTPQTFHHPVDVVVKKKKKMEEREERSLYMVRKNKEKKREMPLASNLLLESSRNCPWLFVSVTSSLLRRG